jgi:hypothetical protein
VVQGEAYSVVLNERARYRIWVEEEGDPERRVGHSSLGVGSWAWNGEVETFQVASGSGFARRMVSHEPEEVREERTWADQQSVPAWP